MKASKTAVATLLAASLPSIVHAQELPVAKPATSWEADFAENDCGLKRQFLLDDAIISFNLRRPAPHFYYELLIFSDKLKRKGRRPTTQFVPDAEPTQHKYFYELDFQEWEGANLSLKSDFFDNSEYSRLNVTKMFDVDFALPLENLDGALEVMDQCLDDLVASWGLDPVEQRSLSKRIEPSSKQRRWITPALKRTENDRKKLRTSMLRILLIVEADGRASSCKILDNLGKTESAKQACERIVKNARLDPALDAEGNPTRSFYLSLSFSQLFTRSISL